MKPEELDKPFFIVLQTINGISRLPSVGRFVLFGVEFSGTPEECIELWGRVSLNWPGKHKVTMFFTWMILYQRHHCKLLGIVG